MPGGETVGWPARRKLISRGGTLFARTILLLPYRDLTGGFKAWRRELLEAIRLRETSGSGYGFQIETTWWAHRRGARIVQVPIVFRERVAGASKMTGGIVREAMLLVLRLRWGAIRDTLRARLMAGDCRPCAHVAHRLGWRLATPSGREGRSRAAA